MLKQLLLVSYHVVSLKQMVQRICRHENGFLPTPVLLEDLQIPEEFTITLTGQPFLLYDSGPEDAN